MWRFGKCTNTAANTGICMIGSGGTEPLVSIQKINEELLKRILKNKEKKEKKKGGKRLIIW